MSISYLSLVNEQLATPVSSESHLVGIIGVSTYASGLILLAQVPESDMPSTVSITGSGGPYNEITSGTPTGGQFLVDYTTGVITFASIQNGNTVSVSYEGLGSQFAASNVNEVQDPLNSIATLTLTYMSPFTSASATWGLTLTNDQIFVGNSSNIATGVTISGDALLANTGALTLATVNFSPGSSTLSSVTTNAKGLITANTSATLTSGDIWVGNGSNIPTAITLSGDATLSNAGILTLSTVNSDVSTYNYATITVNAKGLITAASSGSAPTGIATSFQILSSDPGSPTTGECWFNSIDFQFKGWNGSSVVILG